MFPNKRSSDNKPSTSINTVDLDSNSSDGAYNANGKMKNVVELQTKTIIITEHLRIPCPQLYSDIFGIVLIVCKDPSHDQEKCLKDDSVNDKIEKFLKGKEKLHNNNSFNADASNDSHTDFYRNCTLTDSKIIEREGLKKSINSSIGEDCNPYTNQTVSKGGKLNGY